jgi:hypothetical protein
VLDADVFGEPEMSEKVERLKAQVEAAREALHAAQASLNAATQEYRAAQLEATCLAGHLVEYERQSWRQKEPETIRFVVETLGRWSLSERVGGRIVKKDGTLGTRQVDASIAELKDLGVFESRP